MLDIIQSNASYLAVNKPTRLLTVPGRGPEKQDCLYHRVREYCADALVVHRLDMDTSGLVLFARSADAQRNLSMQFEQRKVDKRYIALVEGLVKQEEGTVDCPIRKDMEQRLPPKHLVDYVHGKKALTEWRVLERYSSTSRLALFPKTGRSHQLRVHMQRLGHPVVGDPIYGTSGERLMLHAESLAFLHPESGDPVRLKCPAPF